MLGKLLIATYVIWLLVGVVWLLPKKLQLLRRVGNRTNVELVALAKSGDAEARQLRRLGWWWFGVGLALIVPLQILADLSKLSP